MAREVAPGPGVVTDDEIAAYVKRNLASCHHQVGTCLIGGGGPDAGNTHAPTMMIGERCAGFLISG